MGIKENIKRLRALHSISQKDLATIAGVSDKAVSSWEMGHKEPRMGAIQKIADHFGMKKSDIIEDDPTYFSTSTIPKQAIRINVYGAIPAGVPIEAIEDIEDWEEIPAEMGVGGKEFIALKVKGDSMYPKYLEGDIVIIQIQPDCESGEDCAVYVNGYDATLKTVKKSDGKITLQPLNPNYAPKTYTHPGEVTILGKVVELRRKI